MAMGNIFRHEPQRVVGRRAGITTDLVGRKGYWKSQYAILANWEVKGPFPTRQAAQDWENKQYGCERSPGGAYSQNPNDLWYGYRFDWVSFQ